MESREHSQKEGLRQDHIKSYVIRAGRMTEGQINALNNLGPKYIIDVSKLEIIDFDAVFDRKAPVVLEIGFGMGASLVQMAKDSPDKNFVGIEVHPPGVGACLKLIEEQGIGNVRIIQYDAFEIFKKCLRDESLDIVQIFFPDPWPKERHHKRRLVNDAFIAMIAPKLVPGGLIRMATDWENYAEQMLEVMNRADGFVNQATDGTYIPRPNWRPLTKFEQRGQRLGHGVWDLEFSRKA